MAGMLLLLLSQMDFLMFIMERAGEQWWWYIFIYLRVVISSGHQVLDEGVQGGRGDWGPISQASSRPRALLWGLLLPRLSTGQMGAEATGSGEHGAWAHSLGHSCLNQRERWQSASNRQYEEQRWFYERGSGKRNSKAVFPLSGRVRYFGCFYWKRGPYNWPLPYHS